MEDLFPFIFLMVVCVIECITQWRRGRCRWVRGHPSCTQCPGRYMEPATAELACCECCVQHCCPLSPTECVQVTHHSYRKALKISDKHNSDITNYVLRGITTFLNFRLSKQIVNLILFPFVFYVTTLLK